MDGERLPQDGLSCPCRASRKVSIRTGVRSFLADGGHGLLLGCGASLGRRLARNKHTYIFIASSAFLRIPS